MGYLICDNCEGYYEIQPGESPDDFLDKCECGGTLSYTDNLINNLKTDEKTRYICSNCLKENDKGMFCFDCGGKLIQVDHDKVISRIQHVNESEVIERLSNNTKPDQRILEKQRTRINWKLTLIGALLVFISSYFSPILIVIVTIVVGFLVGGGAKNGAFNGLIAGFIGGSFEVSSGILLGLILMSHLMLLRSIGMIIGTMVVGLVFAISGAIGGAIGAVINSSLKG